MAAAWFGIGAHHGPEARHTEGVEHAAHQQRRGIAGDVQAENGQQAVMRQHPFAGRDHHEGQDLAEQKLVRRDARDVDLQNVFCSPSLAMASAASSGGNMEMPMHEDAGTVELRGIAAGVVPEPHLRS